MVLIVFANIPHPLSKGRIVYTILLTQEQLHGLLFFLFFMTEQKIASVTDSTIINMIDRLLWHPHPPTPSGLWTRAGPWSVVIDD